MAGIDKSVLFRQAHPPGQSSASSQNKVIYPEAKVTQNEVLGNIGDVLRAPFDVMAFITGNWQLALIGVAAIFLLIRD